MKTGQENRFKMLVFPVILSLGILMLVSLACSTGGPKATTDPNKPTVQKPTTPPKPAIVVSVTPVVKPAVQEPADSSDQAVEPQSVASQAVSTTGSFTEIRDYYGPACPDGEEENAPYRWSVEMLIDPINNAYEGTIKFHNCPGGGRVSYRVSGSSDGSLLHLTGDLVDGGGELSNTAPMQQTFTFNPATGVIEPNLAP